MKKRIVLLALTFCLLFTLCSCDMGNDYSEKYAYSTIATYQNFDDYEELVSALDFVYEDTFLKLFDDGTWCIDMNIVLFINSNIDEGTFTVEGDTYVFEGFEYGLDAYGVKTEDGFEISFYLSDLSDASMENKLVTLFFEKAE